MAEFLLVHGAWHGGWCWRMVADRLRADGHRVFTPTLTGQGERGHLLTAETDLLTHAADVRAVIDCEEMQDVILVGHSYGARPTAVAASHPAVKHWVSLDGVPVIEGQSLVGGLPEEALEAARANLVDGLGSPPIPAEEAGVPADHPLHGWVTRRMTPMSWRAFETPLPPYGEHFLGIPKTYVEALWNTMPVVTMGRDHAASMGLPIRQIDSGHDLMVTAPDETARVLLEIARS